MKRSLLIITLLVACYALLDRLQFFGALFAQSQNKTTRFAPNPTSSTRPPASLNPTQGLSQEDQALATTIRRLANRSSEGLVEKTLPDGGVLLDLQERFQNLALVKLETDGELSVGCVDNIEGANHFFGKNLETGEQYPTQPKQQDESADQAARLGIPQQEYQFYQRLIEDAEQRRALSPNLATITIVNNDGAGEGFNDPAQRTPEGGNAGTTLGQQRLNLFNQAALIWGAFLDSNVPISVRAQFNPLTPCTSGGGVLGSAGPLNFARDLSAFPFANTWYHIALANKLAGGDVDTANPDITATFNSSIDTGCLGGSSRFYYGFDGTSPGGTVNLLIVLLHELGHGLGFSSLINSSTGAFNSGFPDIYSRFLFDRSLNLFWAQMTDAQRAASALSTGNVLWDGPSVRLASSNLTAGRDNATGRVQLFTPSPLQQGSSVSHWDTACTPSLLMEPSITVGLPLNLDLTRQQMRDLGWYRDSTADVVADTIINVTPSGGTLNVGSNANITWTNTGGFNRNVTIELSTDGGTSFPVAIATNVSNTGSFNFTVPNNPTSQGRIRVREYNFAAPVGVSSVNFSIGAISPVLVQQWGIPGDVPVPGDYDGDGKNDYAVWRLGNGVWYVIHSSSGQWVSQQWGLNGDVPVPGDYDNDGKNDFAVWRPSNGTWYVIRSSTNQWVAQQWGLNGDVPVPGDYDGDGKADYAVWRPSSGVWYVIRSSTNQWVSQQWGLNGDVPVPGDYDGDGKNDYAVWRPSSGVWYVIRSSSGQWVAQQWGLNGDVPVPGDYDNDGKTDFAVWRSSSGVWYVIRSSVA
jgi:hypothetical protein